MPVKTAHQKLNAYERERYTRFFSCTCSVQCAAEKMLNLTFSWLHQFASALRMRCCMLMVGM